MADPGFPVGGHGPIRGAWTSDIYIYMHFSPKMCAKMKEFGPVGGHALGTPPRSTNVILELYFIIYTRSHITQTHLYQIITYFEGHLPHQKSLH